MILQHRGGGNQKYIPIYILATDDHCFSGSLSKIRTHTMVPKSYLTIFIIFKFIEFIELSSKFKK